jgi:glycosyltransferase involved in cell wall biosynthesis
MARPLRIVMLSPTGFSSTSVVGGGERYVENLARAVAVAGRGAVEVMVVTLGPEDETREEVTPGVHIRVVRSSKATNVVDAVSWEIEEAIHDAALVHVHQAYSRFGQVAVVAAATHRIPIVITDHGGPTLSARARAEMRLVADDVLAYSQFGAEMAGGATAIVPGGVDTDWFSPPESASGRSGFAYVGRILPHKRIERAITALPAGARLQVCGQVANEQYLEELRELARGRDVVFIHDADDAAIRDLYRSTLGLVLLSEHVDRYGNFYRAPELMGLTVLEAMACGTAPIVSTVGALPEFVIEDQTGHIVQDDDRLAQVLAEVHADPERAVALGTAARDYILGRWDFATVGERILDVYRRTMAGYDGEGAA